MGEVNRGWRRMAEDKLWSKPRIRNASGGRLLAHRDWHNIHTCAQDWNSAKCILPCVQSIVLYTSTSCYLELSWHKAEVCKQPT